MTQPRHQEPPRHQQDLPRDRPERSSPPPALSVENYPPLAHVRFPQKNLAPGEPDVRPANGRCLISRSTGMAAIEADLHGCALLASVLGTRPPVSPESLVQALEHQAGVDRGLLQVEVTYPADFLVSFKSAEDCVRVYQRSGDIRCNGARIAFKRWHRTYQATGGKLEFFTKLSFDGIQADAWDWDTVKQVVNSLGGHLVEILPSEDRRGCEIPAVFPRSMKLRFQSRRVC